MSKNTLCGLACWHPQWLQRFANSKAFIVVYGILGTTQAMAYMYFVITLQTLEKRFKIPSQTTGLILSGNEISQILLSLVLSYFGGQRNRPRWISWGVVCCALSCFILAAPHFIYGAGDDALALTKEFMDEENAMHLLNATLNTSSMKGANRLCSGITAEEKCDELFSIIPLVLIFLSQFILGIGNTLYYSLGQTFLDDNTKKTNTPIMLAYALALRTFGPVVGFIVGFTSLKLYIDPTKTPLIDSKDPRWLGAWWLGWLIFGSAMMVLAFFIALFPKVLPKKEAVRPSSNMPKALINDENAFSEDGMQNSKYLQQQRDREIQEQSAPVEDAADANPAAQLKDFPSALLRLLKNKILMYNILSSIFYILGASGYITFLSKYLEVQFHKNAADATIVTGPITLFGMVAGFFISGLVISKKKPGPRPLLMWNVIVGCMYMVGQISYLFLTCPDGKMPLVQGRLNLSTSCNQDCYCEGVSYSPICHEESGFTFFSPCHAGCSNWEAEDRYYSGCTCANDRYSPITDPWTDAPTQTISTTKSEYQTTTRSSTTGSTTITSTAATDSPITSPGISDKVQLEEISSNNETIITQVGDGKPLVDPYYEIANPNSENSRAAIESPAETDLDDVDRNTYYNVKDDLSETPAKTVSRRDTKSSTSSMGVMIPGACLKGCAVGFYMFTIVASIINCFGASGRIGSMLINFRCVSTQDKSFTQGLILMMISLFALIPGPILYGRIIDSTCLVWSEKCGKLGNCQLYDQKSFRYYINLTAFGLTTVGVLFDLLVWHYGKNLDLYGDREKEAAGKTLTKENAEANDIDNEFIVKNNL